jgi:hypothetical protein
LVLGKKSVADAIEKSKLFSTQASPKTSWATPRFTNIHVTREPKEWQNKAMLLKTKKKLMLIYTCLLTDCRLLMLM